MINQRRLISTYPVLLFASLRLPPARNPRIPLPDAECPPLPPNICAPAAFDNILFRVCHSREEKKKRLNVADLLFTVNKCIYDYQTMKKKNGERKDRSKVGKKENKRAMKDFVRFFLP